MAVVAGDDDDEGERVMDELQYPAGWVPAMAPGLDDDDEADGDYGRESLMVCCADCAEDVYVTSAQYDDVLREWVCDECLDLYGKPSGDGGEVG